MWCSDALEECSSGVLGAMDIMYQRGKIQEESLYCEHRKHDGGLPLVSVNMFLSKEHAGEVANEIELIRSTEGEKGQQITNVVPWQTERNLIVMHSWGVRRAGTVVSSGHGAATGECVPAPV